MRKQAYLKHLDRAFTKAPDELTASIEEAFRRGEKAVKQRQKIMTALSVAAAVAVLCAAIALAAGRMITPKPDTVATRGSATSRPGRTLLNDTHSPIHEPTPAPVPQNALELVYTQPNSKYYHGVPDCSGMEDAVAWTLESAVSVGKRPCPICMDGQAEIEETGRYTPEPEQVGYAEMAESGEALQYSEYEAVFYATPEGRYYHEDAGCSGMQGAMPWSFEALWFTDKQPCPVCIEVFNTPELRVYATPKGRYYHVFRDCSGMKNATAFYNKAAAEEVGKAPCPVCVSGGDSFCWATSGGQYYHRERTCMGMWGALVYTEPYCSYLGKQPCPVCRETQ